MAGKYDRLTVELRVATERGQRTVDMEFDQVAVLVGGLPPSAMSRQWWANSSHTQAAAWHAAGFHVASVSLNRRRVRFSLGQVGGTYNDNGRRSTAPERKAATSSGAPSVSEWVPVGDPVEIRVVLQWTDAGRVVLDGAGKPKFVPLPAVPGLYRFTLAGAPGQERPRVYIGESRDLARRLAGNYRSPGNNQQTSLRINALLREHLKADGYVELVIATSATAHMTTAGHCGATSLNLDLSHKAARLLVENAALVLAQLADDADIENLP